MLHAGYETSSRCRAVGHEKPADLAVRRLQVGAGGR